MPFYSGSSRPRNVTGDGSREVHWRFLCKVHKTSTCWLWLAGINKGGYGVFKYRGARILAHRMAWILFRGFIPRGKDVLHNCPGGDNPACVNPTHLWLGIDADNVADKVAKGRQAKGEKAGNVTLTTLHVRCIRLLYRTGMFTQRELARMFGVSHMAVWAIVSGKTWKHLIQQRETA